MNQLDVSGKTETDIHYLKCAFSEAIFSDDPKARIVRRSGVGAVIVLNGDIIGKSANILPPALKSRFSETDRPILERERYHFIEHAERAAIFEAYSAGKSISGATIYCTRYPCSDCARAIVWSGVRRAVFASGFASEIRWAEAQRAARDIFRDSGVTVRILQLDQ